MKLPTDSIVDWINAPMKPKKSVKHSISPAMADFSKAILKKSKQRHK